MKAWINGKIVDSKNAVISIFDRGFLYGDGVFESMRSYNGVIFGLNEHLARLENGLRIVKIKISYSTKELKKAAYHLLGANRLKDAYVRLNVTRGEGRFAIGAKERFSPTVIIFTKPFVPYPQRMYERGVCAKVVSTRINERSPISKIKPLSFLNNILARIEARSAGFDEAILMNGKGYIAEAATSNIFLVESSKLKTPPLESGILPGVARSTLLRLAKYAGLKIQERNISYQELMRADEIFLTNSLFEILPVVQVDKHNINRHRVGGWTRLLHENYKGLTNNLSRTKISL